MVRIEDSAAIVFGAASGLGEATARSLAAAGRRVMLADIAAERVAELAAEIGADAVGVDVCDAASVEAAVAAAAELGPLRVSVTCAGVATPGRLLTRDGPGPLESFARVIDVNLLGAINALRCVAAAMLANDADADGQRGVCVNTASIAAFEGQVGQVAYAASKAGIVGLTLPVARELAGSGIRVVTIAPGLFDTPLLAGLPEPARASLAGTVPNPPRLGRPDEYAALVAHVIDNPMLNGETIRLDGALRMAPR